MTVAEKITDGLRAYPAYKDSGVPWIGEVPEGWEVRRLKHTCRVNSRVWPENTDPNQEISYIEISDVDGLHKPVPSRMAFSGAPSRARRIVKQGDVIISTVRTYLKAVQAIDDDLDGCTVSTGFAVLTPKDEIVPKFLGFALLSEGFMQTVIANSRGVSYPAIEASSLANLPCAFPPPDEQQAIAAFLDRETARINELLREQETLLEDLQEKQQAVITRAVTRGLDPNATLKDSGVPWIGETPLHWGTRRLKQMSPEQTVGVVVNPSTYVDPAGTVPFLVGSNITEQGFKLQQLRYISEESNVLLQKTRLRAGDLVTVRVGAPGVTAVIPPELDGANCASVMIVRQSPSFDSRWLAYAFNSRIGRAQVEVVQYGAAQEQFNISHAVDFIFPYPSLAEQRVIAAHLDQQLAQIDTLAAEVRASIEDMRLHRSALITAAVTGKIDVRDQRGHP